MTTIPVPPCPPQVRREEPTPAPASAPSAGPPATASGRAPVPERLAQAGSFALRLLAAAYLMIVLITIVFYKATFAEMLVLDPFFVSYGIVVCIFIVSRFLLSALHRPPRDAGLEPRVAVVMPAFNEEDAIAASIEAILALDYPEGKLEVCVVNDGSTDATRDEVRRVMYASGGRVRFIEFETNRGKRAAMAAGIRATEAEVVAFVDSDSVLEPDAVRVLVQGFADERVGAIVGTADVLNVSTSWITRMQAVRYFVAFRVCKAAESLFGAVTCCSGCFSAYRRQAILPSLDWWEHQTFLGRPSTYGDDRSLTNCVLRTWRVRYEPRAMSHTIVPETFRQFMRQQLRWKRSWTRESLIVASFIWRKNPIAALSTYVGILLPLVAPVIAVRSVTWQPLVAGSGAPIVYLVGVYAMALAYGLYYAMRHDRYDTLWVYGVAFCFFYLAFLLWQTYYAIVTSRSSSWGTRPATAGQVAAAEGPA